MHQTSYYAIRTCVSCKLSLAYSLYSLKQFYLYGICGRVCESASVCMTLMFCSCSSLIVSVKNKLKIIKKTILFPFQNLLMRFITNTPLCKWLYSKLPNFLLQEVIKVFHTVLYWLDVIIGYLRPCRELRNYYH